MAKDSKGRYGAQRDVYRSNANSQLTSSGDEREQVRSAPNRCPKGVGQVLLTSSGRFSRGNVGRCLPGGLHGVRDNDTCPGTGPWPPWREWRSARGAFVAVVRHDFLLITCNLVDFAWFCLIFLFG